VFSSHAISLEDGWRVADLVSEGITVGVLPLDGSLMNLRSPGDNAKHQLKCLHFMLVETMRREQASPGLDVRNTSSASQEREGPFRRCSSCNAIEYYF
jgi:hypothetical protein